MIQSQRLSKLNENPVQEGDYVLYWMQASPRSHYNHALEYSIMKANHLKKPLLVYFGLTNDFPEANKRHYSFLLQGLQNTKISLEKRGIKMVVQLVSPPEGARELAENASMLITDKGYLKIQREWIQMVIDSVKCPMQQVETNVVVPLETASPKEEYSAATLRRKINKRLKDFLVPLKMENHLKSSQELDIESITLDNLNRLMKRMRLDSKVESVEHFKGGTENALKLLDDFLKNKIDKFEERNDPTRDYLSHMSPYLHFGQISPLYIALKVLKTNSPGKNAYLEELIIRRELAMNFVYYNPHYHRLNCLPEWALKTLMKHRNDKREYLYSFKDFENAETHDPYWNAAQNEMRYKGKMHGYMRMYWGKKILEWTNEPEEAYQIALTLNNKYELDGRDPNGFAGVAWCFGKHDRAWKEREIYGKVRYMNANGLKRKFKIDLYVDSIEDVMNNTDMDD
ncbi:MAG: deoxyribodipyrimidine photo-lyase [Methanobacteriaceae archaeon]|nr:deoxyribodipyrimidine photo-lyase [Methanobacteriaceae archaeon]